MNRRSGFLLKVLKALLYPVFSAFLLIPWIRRHRRSSRWQAIRAGAGGIGVALLAYGIWAGAALVLLAALLGPLPDPDRLQKIAEALGAQHVLNGGFYGSGDLPLPLGAPLLFFLNAYEILIVPAQTPDQVLARHPFPSIHSILLAGQPYRPRYISFAKQPPRRDEKANRTATCRLTLSLDSSTLVLEYRGVFAPHLAEVAAHTLYCSYLTRGRTDLSPAISPG